MLFRTEPVVFLRGFGVFIIEHSGINQESHGHIGIVTRLMFVKVEGVGNQKGYIVFHAHIDGVFNGIQTDCIRVCV